MNAKSINDLADRFFSAIEKGDRKALDEIYTSDAVVWHNNDNVDQPRDANIEMCLKFPTMFKSFGYFNIRRAFLDQGFVQQHAVRGVTKDGKAFEVHACMVITVRGNQIARIDDYLDSAQVTPIFGKLE